MNNSSSFGRESALDGAREKGLGVGRIRAGVDAADSDVEVDIEGSIFATPSMLEMVVDDKLGQRQ